MEEPKNMENSCTNLLNEIKLNEEGVSNLVNDNFECDERIHSVVNDSKQLNMDITEDHYSRSREDSVPNFLLNTVAPLSKLQSNTCDSSANGNKEISTQTTNAVADQTNNHYAAVNKNSCLIKTSFDNSIPVLNDEAIQSICHSSMIELQNKLFPYVNLEQNEEKPNGQFLQDSAGNYQHDIPFSVEYMDPDTICGFGSFRPQWLQKYATARSYLILYSIVGIIQGSYFTYLVGALSTLEKRYAFKSKISGTIMMVDEITPLLLGIVVGYFGGRMHRPRVLAVGMFLNIFCCFISALPYFMFGTSQQLVASVMKNETGDEYCGTMKRDMCDENDRPPTISAAACLIIGSFCKGFGSLAYYAVGLSYLDDNAKKKNTPLYFAIVEAFRLCGPLFGFLISSAFLKYYEDPFGDPGYGPDDPRWIGAWWLGFVLQGTLMIIFAWPLLLFPRRLPKQKTRAFSNTKDFAQENNMQRIMGLVNALKRLIMNPLYIIFTFASIFSLLGSFGLYIMLPKYMELQFHLSASEANLLAGPPVLVATQLATLFGGWAIWKWRPSAKKLLVGQVLVGGFWTIGALVLMLPSCQHFNMAGTTQAEYGLEVQNKCNADCLCSTSTFSPICGPDGVSNYFSPCHAGCLKSNQTKEMEFSNCSCLIDFNGNRLDSSIGIKRGLCKTEDCWSQAIFYMILFPILGGITNILIVAHMMILLRCIEPQDKSLALGLFETLNCALAFVPYPMIFGALVDSACLIWENSCGHSGNCWFYDIDKLNYLMHGTSAIFEFISTICFAIICTMSDKVQDLYNDDAGEAYIDIQSPKKDQVGKNKVNEVI